MFLGRVTRLQTFCGCIPLRLGCLIIGYIETAGNSFGIFHNSTGEEGWEDVILYILGAAGLVLINLLMIWGIHKSKRKFLLPWLITKFVLYLGFTLVYGGRIGETIIFIIPSVTEKDIRSLMITVLTVFVTVLLIGWYTFFCVYSYYKIGFSELREPEKKEIDKKIKQNQEKKIDNDKKKEVITEKSKNKKGKVKKDQ